ncbi:MAG: prepilin-type cleavage/methylation domain-containing protein [bacterium]|nr:prepilin-type cleavage/methylation domain-containing protein [bacterium]
MTLRRSLIASGAKLARCDGTTLVELIVAVLLLGLFAAVAGPRFFGALAGDMGDGLFTQEVVTAVRYGQKLAVTSGCRVQLDFTSSSYAVTQESGCSGGSFSLAVRNPGTGSSPYSGTAGTGITLASTVDPLLFDALGRATTSAGVVSDATLTIGSKTINVSGETGLAWTP